jgi:hypothetical protein
MAFSLFWGDLHRHSSEGDGRDPLVKHFATARDVLRLNFMAMTNCGILTRDPMDRSLMRPLDGKKSITDGASMHHLNNLLDLHRVRDEDWALNQRLVKEYTEPGRFVPLLAYEWSCARYGDRNIFYRHPDEPMRLAPTLPDLYRSLEQTAAMLIPHHPGYAVGRRGVNWGMHHPRLERLVEIVSNHGCSEEPRGGVQPLQNIGMGSNVPGSSVRDAWARDLHLGVVAGSDCHRGAHEFLLTGLYAEACTPDAIWQALWDRRTFATTRGKRLVVDFSADGFPVGTRYATDSPPQLDVTIRGAGPIACVELWKQGALWRTEEGRGRVEFTVGYRDLDEPVRPDTMYWVRVFQEDGTAAWSSPIWVAFLPEHPAARGFLYWQPDEPARLEVDVARRTGRQAELLLVLRNEDLDGAILTEPTIEIREGDSGRAIASERFESLPHFRDGALRAIVDGLDPAGDLCYRATYRDGHGTLRHIRRTFPTRQGGSRP